jgi:hypothetical protein
LHSLGIRPYLCNVKPDRRPSFHHQQGNIPLPNWMSIGKLPRGVKSKPFHPYVNDLVHSAERPYPPCSLHCQPEKPLKPIIFKEIEVVKGRAEIASSEILLSTGA